MKNSRNSSEQKNPSLKLKISNKEWTRSNECQNFDTDQKLWKIPKKYGKQACIKKS